MNSEITKEAFFLLMGNDEESWRNYTRSELAEISYYYNHGVHLQTVTNFISSTTQYFIQDINA